MEQRSLRLGDVVDDYCPRERRVTNHVIVALVGDAVRQTRCSTCDAEHVYKAARLPRRRGKDDGTVDNTGGQLVSRVEPEPVAEAPAPHGAAPVAGPPASAAPAANGAAPTAMPMAAGEDERGDDVWPGHRPLIRASLPRVEGEIKEPRPIPEFTMHQRQGRGGGHYRGGDWPNGNGNGNSNGNSNANGNTTNSNGGYNGHGRGGGGFRQSQPGQNPQGPGGGPGAGPGGRRRRRRRGRGRGPGPGGPKPE